MSGYTEYPNAIEGNDAPYFPPLYEKPDCAKCERFKDCLSYGKYQRDRRDFTYTSGRCPRLPDMRGFVEQEERELYARTFPLLRAESAGETLHSGALELWNRHQKTGYDSATDTLIMGERKQ